MLDKEVGKEEDIGTSVLEGRHVDGKLVDAVIEVLSELAFGYRLRQIFVGGTDESDIHINLLRAAQRTDFPLLQGSEELHLYFVVEVSHLIEENRSAVSNLEGTLLILFGSGKGTLLISEEFRCRHLLRDGTAVDGIERLILAQTLFMDAARHIFLSGAAGSENEYRHRGRGNERNELVELFGSLAFTFYISRHFRSALLLFLGCILHGGRFRRLRGRNR